MTREDDLASIVLPTKRILRFTDQLRLHCSTGGVTDTSLSLDAAGFLSTGSVLLVYAIVPSTRLSVKLFLGELIMLPLVPGGKVTIAGRSFDQAWDFASRQQFSPFGQSVSDQCRFTF